MLPRPRQAVLLRWLKLLQNTMPVAWKIQPVLEALLEKFETIVKGEEHLLAVLDRFPRPEPKWSPSCTKDEPGMGYTCGLWELFHIMSVGMMEWNLLLPDDKELRMAESGDAVGKTLRDFIENFFGCDECRQNFVTAYDSCFLDVCKRLTYRKRISHWIQFPLWLFEMHNAVRQRLVKEKAKREDREVSEKELDAAVWPKEEECPLCWEDDGSLNGTAVFQFLRVEYW